LASNTPNKFLEICVEMVARFILLVRQKVREDGTPETEMDLLDWLK